MSPVGDEPFGRLHHLRTELNRLIELLVEDPVSARTTWLPPVDLVERERAVEVQLEVPGVTAADLQVELVDQKLLVRGTKPRLPGEAPSGRFHLAERFIGPFSVSVDLSLPVLPAQATARLHQGVLTVTLPKLHERRHRHHVISVEDV
jgi:HSP20 family protein